MSSGEVPYGSASALKCGDICSLYLSKWTFCSIIIKFSIKAVGYSGIPYPPTTTVERSDAALGAA